MADDVEAKLAKAREDVAAKLGGLAGKHEPVVLLHAVAWFLGGLCSVSGAMRGKPTGEICGEVGSSLAAGALAEELRRKFAAMPPAGRA
jgi:hypothetical protein